MTLGEGQTFAGYTVVRRLGAGGMGEVYLVQHPRLPRRDALKLLASHVSADTNFRDRFLREADLASTLWHPHIVGVHDRGEDEGQLWISMDYVDGEDASHLLSRKYPKGMPTELVLDIVEGVAAALDHAHKQGLLHRDVKPANIMLTNEDDSEERRVLLADFGIARNLDDTSGLTATNMTLGTTAYTAPEQLTGSGVDGRADQYSLAATAFHLLTGSTPFEHSNPAVVIGRHLNSEPPPVSGVRPELAGLDGVLATALAKDPNKRFATCGEFARALAEHATPRAVGPTVIAETGLAAPATQVAPARHDPRETQVAPARHDPRETAQPVVPQTLSPGWYPDPNGGSRPVYWDGQRWQAAVYPAPAGGATSNSGLGRSAALLIGLGVAAAVVALGALAFVLLQDKEPAPPPLSSSSSSASARVITTPNAGGPPVITEPPIPPASYPPPPSVFSGVVVGTCDEGGSCGVRQRNAPYVAAPSLVPNTLQDGSSVTARCQTNGDAQSSAGHGTSFLWYRLDNGAYVNSVYLDMSAATGIPTC
jgi:serine/threonine protein kinase, bacterial